MKKTACFKLLLLAFSFFVIAANAQSLPNKQEVSLYAPANIKIDGKATEWDNKFQAYNKATEIFYIVANDDQNLYLVVKATNPDIINKIYDSGLTFTINPSGKKSDKGGIAVTYPVFDSYRFHVNLLHKPKIIPDSQASILKADSFMNANNKLMTEKANLIKVKGIKGTDTLISIYNEEGIKAAALFDNQMVYTLEMGIPLKYLGHDLIDLSSFSYHIQLNPLRSGVDNMNYIYKTDPSSGKMIKTLSEPIEVNAMMSKLAPLSSITDFWGEYTIAKK